MRRMVPHVVVSLVAVAILAGAIVGIATSQPGSVRYAQLHSASTAKRATASIDLLWTEGPGTDRGAGTVVIGNPRTSSITTLAPTSAGSDVAAGDGYVYWANYDSGSLGRSTVSGSSVDQRFVTGAHGPVPRVF